MYFLKTGSEKRPFHSKIIHTWLKKKTFKFLYPAGHFI